MFVEIIPGSKIFKDIDTFTYRVPANLESEISIGALVEIPFGRKTIRGVIFQIKTAESEIDTSYQIKSIKSVVPGFKLPESYLKIARWVADYYLCSPGEAISIFLPPEMKRPRNSNARTVNDQIGAASAIRLTREQEQIFQQIKSLGTARPALLHGVTGSGKTEIYLKLTQEVVNQGKQAIVLVPEIILTPQTIERFQAVFGDQIALIHHSLSRSEKFRAYFDFYTGTKPIIVGPRSSLLVPSTNLGMIIVDEEQEDAYKQEQSPRYHAVTLAEKIAAETGARLLLGTATPRVESYYKATTGDYHLFEMKNRFGKEANELPPATIIDLKNELRSGNASPISDKLSVKIQAILEAKKQVLLFLNRRGTATFVSCRDCGHIQNCPNCSIPLVYHVDGSNDRLNCHHCDHQSPVPTRCPACGGARIRFFGSGVEKIESEVRNLFPNARIQKADATTIKSKNDYDQLYQALKSHRVDIVIGTQMIAKGLDIPNIDLVGIVSADTGLHLPHYRASERSFQLITQVSGRSGRRSHQGETIIQTYWPDAAAIQAASSHDFSAFYLEEIGEREKYSYPPFCHLIRIVSEETAEEKALSKLNTLAEKLKTERLDFAGPAPCFYRRLHGKFRFHLIIKTKQWPSEKIMQISRQFNHLVWDVDPVNLL